MTQQVIITTPTNSGAGTTLNEAFDYCNDNFSQLFSRAQSTPPATLIGSPGDSAGMYAYSSSYFYYCFANYDGTSVIWAQVTQLGNISISQIVNGNSNVLISSSGGNITFNVTSTANVVTVSPSQVSVAGNVVATNFLGNGVGLTGVVLTSNLNSSIANYLPTYTGSLYPTSIFTNGYFYANGVPFSSGGGGSTYGDSNVAAYLPTYTGSLGGSLTTSVQSNITTLGNLTGLTVNGLNAISITPSANNITLAPIFGGTVTITSSGTGSIDNITIGANSAQSGRFTSVSATGNVTGTYIIGDGSLLTNISGGGGGDYSNANVAAYLPTYTGNILAGNIAVGNNQTISGNLTVTGTANVTGNVNANVVGQLTGTVNGINMSYLIWDFGSITGNTFSTPIAWIFSTTAAGNIDMGSIASPSSNNIDIGTIY